MNHKSFVSCKLQFVGFFFFLMLHFVEAPGVEGKKQQKREVSSYSKQLESELPC